MWLPILAGAGLGALQYDEQKRQAKAQRDLAALTALYSPWTGLTPDMNIKEPSVTGTVGQGALMGGLIGQSIPESSLASAEGAVSSNLASGWQGLKSGVGSMFGGGAAAPVATEALASGGASGLAAGMGAGTGVAAPTMAQAAPVTQMAKAAPLATQASTMTTAPALSEKAMLENQLGMSLTDEAYQNYLMQGGSPWQKLGSSSLAYGGW